jgi:AcrR family transcriptional regulator
VLIAIPMENLLSVIKVKVGKGLYQSDPSASKLGQKILSNAIDMIAELGFEKFTFKKLGEQIGSPEASVYRYFKSKQQLLSYLVSWYWGWMEYRLIALITSDVKERILIDGIDTKKLHQIIIHESIKSYLIKDVDLSNKEGCYMNYKQFVARMAEIVKEINPDYKYPQMLLTTIIEGAHLQVFFGEHLPRLTNKQKSPHYITEFYTGIALKSIKLRK